MIELNCSYEESKKILELGYDFSKVCWKTGYYWDEAYLEHTCGTGLLIETQAYRISYLNDHKGNTRDHTPIIPKAALEACLKIDLPTHSQYSYRYFEKCCGDDDIDLEGSKNLIKFNSAYEAFMWCHENYPEELKKKFNEVMA